MEGWMKKFALVMWALVVFVGFGCGKDEKSTADRDAEIKKALQQGAQKEQKMYEGMQKGVENLEKAMKEQKEKSQ